MFNWWKRKNNDKSNQAQNYSSNIFETKFVNSISQDMMHDFLTNYDYNKFVQEGYMKNPIVYRCVQEISSAATNIPFVLYDQDDKIINNHALLRLLHHPNADQSRSSFIETAVHYRLLSGNVFFYAHSSPPTAIYVLRPDRVTVLPGEGSIPRGYEYRVNDQLHTFPIQNSTGINQVMHWKTFNPQDDWYGLSPLQPISKSIEIHNLGSAWNRSLLNHSCRPSGALVSRNDLTEEQFDRLKSQLERSYSGENNAGKTFVFEGGLSWMDMSITPKDMDFLSCMQNAAREIAFALGVPPMLVGLQGDNTYSNQKEARLALWEQTVVPLMLNFCDVMTNWLLPHFSDIKNLRIGLDLDQISALAQRRMNYWHNMVEGVKNNIITINEARVALGYTSSRKKVADSFLTENQNKK